ncbi:3469_t:CDS:2 [Funneliformis caledonium]|uniref:3469_t:CDS:1 n=1 Tax=Funneliformis caledonium TaxID=1117310 RepID=A0A9N8ZYL6_9GLOM|nr:3469_t:CDS:2 [Funneliformis caledonium]
MTLFKSKVKPSDTKINEPNEKNNLDEKNYNSSIIPTDDDDCTITIVVPPTARPVNSRYSMQYLQQTYSEEDSPGRLRSTNVKPICSKTKRFTWKSILIIFLIAFKMAIIIGLLIYYAYLHGF